VVGEVSGDRPVLIVDLEIRRLGPGDEPAVLAAGDLFDGEPDERWTSAFLAEPGHHLLVAFDGGRAVGFVTGVEMLHPDKGREMFLYELSVGEEWRRQGVAKALLAELAAIARDRDCYDMWVLTEDDNEAAVAAYQSSGAKREGLHAMFEWRFGARQALH
jgi:ribosomal protein S18 acetylase RimI-like enzyme